MTENRSDSNTLLATKLYIPPRRPSLVSRPRLTERLGKALQAGTRLTLVSAPAGFGKTTLLSEWLHGSGETSQPQQMAWISLDEGDNDPARFLAYLTSALQAMEEDLLQGLPGALHSPQPPPMESLLAELVNRVARMEKARSLVIVLDDYHTIQAQPVHDAVAFLLTHLPPPPVGIHLVIASRSDPPLPLARLRARGQLTELRATDLRFTVGEAATFLNRVMGLHLAAEDVAALDARTEGWITGLHLAAISLQGQSPEHRPRFVQDFAGSDRFVLDYLLEEVLSHEPEPIQAFLLETSILERLSGPLCEAVCSISLESTDIPHRGVIAGASAGQPVRSHATDGGQAVLERLERDNLFVIPLDNERRWYRYHRLFADLLRARLGKERAVPLHSRASEWYAERGFTTDAIRHALAAGDSRRAADLAEGSALALLKRGELTRLLAWLVTLPDAEIRQRPWLCIYYAWALALSGQLGAVEPRLQDAERVMGEPSPEDPIVGHMAAIRAYISVPIADPSTTIQLAHEALKLLPEDELVARSVVAFTLGGAYLLSGDVAGAARAFSEASAMGQAAGNLHLAAPATSHLADLQVQQGQLRQAAETYREVLRLATTPAGQSLPVAAQGHSGLGELMYEWNDLPSAERHLAKSIELGKLWGNRHALIADYVALARVLMAQGEKKRAQEALHEADALAPGQENPLPAARVAAQRAQIEMVQGNLAAAERWAQECETHAAGETGYMREYEHLTLARLQIARQQPGEALSLLARLVQRADVTRRMGNLVEALALQALAFQAQGDMDQATASLSQALSLAEPEGYVRVFVDEGEPMAKLLGALGDQKPAASREYVAKLLASLGSGVEVKDRFPTGRAPSLIEPLSEREMEVLRLVAAGLTNQEIGDQLVIALSTVKSHTNHIYGKLGVKNRTQAIARARAWGILSEDLENPTSDRTLVG